MGSVMLRPGASGGGSPNLLSATDFTYLGAFKIGEDAHGSLGDIWAYGASQMCGNVYEDPTYGKTLFIKGRLSGHQVDHVASVGQVSIPALLNPDSVGYAGLNTAPFRRGFVDASNGMASTIKGNENGYGSLVHWGGKLIGFEAIAYDSGTQINKAAWVGNLDLTTSGVTGPYGFTAIGAGIRTFAGYACPIPSEWRASLGGTILAGDSVRDILASGATAGPTAHILDGDALAAQPSAATAIANQPLLYYDYDHQRIGAYDPVSRGWTGTTNVAGQVINGVAVHDLTFTVEENSTQYTLPPYEPASIYTGVLFPDGTRTIVFFACRGLGTWHYGDPDDDGFSDPANSEKGNHTYPYTMYGLFYDVNDLLAVKASTKLPYEVNPYAAWAFKPPTYTGFVNAQGAGGYHGGCAWDVATRRMYITARGYYGGTENDAIVHCYSVGTP